MTIFIPFLKGTVHNMFLFLDLLINYMWRIIFFFNAKYISLS